MSAHARLDWVVELTTYASGIVVLGGSSSSHAHVERPSVSWPGLQDLLHQDVDRISAAAGKSFACFRLTLVVDRIRQLGESVKVVHLLLLGLSNG